MIKIAYLASTKTLPGSPDRRSDAFEHDYMMDALRGAFETRGMTLEDVDWADEQADWSTYAAAIIGTTWDYWDQPEHFLRTLERIEAETKLFNSADMVRWNSDKRYLRGFQDKGARTIPTLWIDKVDPAAFRNAFDELASQDLVFKRQIGAGADGQYRLSHEDPLPAMPYPMMVQPFQKAIQDEGEFSFIFIDGAFSHALLKQAKSGDYRIQSSYGGFETKIAPSQEDICRAAAILEFLDEVPLYARVDMIRGTDGEMLLMELELIEPYLYPKEGPNLGPMMAAAVAKRLGL